MAKKVSKTKRSRRRMTAKPKSTRKKPKARRRTTALKTETAKQIHVYENPFSVATHQPKIPDGKVHKSLGLSNQAVGEIIAGNATNNGPSGSLVTDTGILHVLLYAGQNTGGVIFGSVGSATTSTGVVLTQTDALVEHMGYGGSSDITASTLTAGGGELIFANNYAAWRAVSHATKFGLLNPSEQDDGWWEMCRINEALDTDEYAVLSRTRENSSFAQGTISPRFLINDLVNRDLTRDPSYRTGMLRSIHNEEFQLMPTYRDHDFQQQMDVFDLENDDVLTVGNISPADGKFVTFGDGRDNCRQLINQWIDPSFDMIYLRFRGRSVNDNTRLHYNQVSNQEVTFSTGTREHRFMDETENRPLDVIEAKSRIREKQKAAHAELMKSARAAAKKGPGS